MEFKEFFTDAKDSITIIGTNPLIPHLEQSASFFVDLLTLNDRLKLTVLYESDSENFNQSLCIDTDFSTNKASYASLSVHRDRISGVRKGGGLLYEILHNINDDDIKNDLIKRIKFKQCNLRIPINLILSDDKLWCCIVTHNLPDIDSYFLVNNNNLRKELHDFIDFYISDTKGGIYLSEPTEEMIQLFDKDNIPRGIFPRSCFYTTSFQRYSIWGFVFNRHGKLLLHQRSMTTNDGRGLWDKSIGGHVDLRDRSTYITAQRELVEELFLPEAEYSKYIQAELGDIISFGDWNIKKRLEGSFKQAFESIEPADWIMFRATDESRSPLTVTRISKRRMHDVNNNVNFRPSIFMSDVYLFIAPPNYIDTNDQMKRLLSIAEKTGAANDHRLVSIGELRAWIQEKESEGTQFETFTDDLIYIHFQHRDLLEKFSEFIQYIF